MRDTKQLMAAALGERGRATCMSVRLFQEPVIAHLAAAAGFDALYVDLEHAVIPADRVVTICMAARSRGLAALVRLPAHYADIGPLLDGGVDGLIVTGVDDPEALGPLLQASQFPPEGRRSINWSTPSTDYRRPADPGPFLASHPYVAVMVESAAAVAGAEAFAAIEAVDMLFIGCSDFALSIGRGEKVGAPEVEEGCRLVGSACRKAGKHLGLGGLNSAPALVSRLLEGGPAMITAGSDQGMLAEALHRNAAGLAAL